MNTPADNAQYPLYHVKEIRDVGTTFESDARTVNHIDLLLFRRRRPVRDDETFIFIYNYVFQLCTWLGRGTYQTFLAKNINKERL